MAKPLISRVATVLGGLALATAATVGFAGPAAAVGPCHPQEPTCSTLTYDSANATVRATIKVGNTYDNEWYQVRWTINRNGAVQTFGQNRINVYAPGNDGYASFGPIAPADRGFVIGFSAQSCSGSPFGSSCSPWEVKSIVPLPYGPDTCAQGYVWRDAFAGDHICVTPASRDQAATDNAAAPSRVNPQGAWGPNTCVNGYVWRAARSTDLVCVTPAIRTQTANENADPNAHRA